MEGERQARLGNLQDMTLPQLQELLDRQTKLFSRQKFLRNLPDGGQKVKDLADKLQQMISQRQKCLPSQAHTDSLHSTTSSQHTLDDDRSIVRNGSPVTQINDALSRSETVPKTSQRDGGEIIDATATLSDCMNSLVISELSASRMTDKSDKNSGPPRDGGNLEMRFPHSYENIMKRSQVTGNKRAPFKPNSSLKIGDIHQLPDEFKLKSKSTASPASSSTTASHPSDGQTQVSRKAVVKPHEDIAVTGPVYKFKGAKEISVQESILLQRQQQEKLEKMQTLHAAERLAERLNIKTVDYNPSAPDMEYRSLDPGRDDDICDSDTAADEDDTLD